MRIPSGKTDQLIFFVAVDSTDLKTRKTGLTTFTVYRSRNGGTATVYTTPTVAELDATNMPGVYSLAIDEDTTIAAGSDSEEYCVHITQASMAPVTRTIELYRRDTTTGRTLDVSAGGEAGLDWANVGSPTTTLALTGTTIAVTQKVDVDTIKTNPVVNGGTVTFTTNSTVASTTNITAGTITTATNVTTVNGLAANVITAAATAADFGTEIATAIWTDTTAGDFTVAASIGKSVMNGVVLGTGLTIATAVAVTTVNGLAANVITAAATAADFGTEIAAAVWQDAVAGDFTVASSIGKALYIANIAPGGSGGHFISGSNAGTTTLAAMTVTGALTVNGIVPLDALISSRLAPTVAARTLDVSATGEAGIDWANIGAPTTAQNFTATQIQSVNNLAAGSDSINTTATVNSTLTTGSTVSGTYASTAPLDGTYWQISDTAGTLDMYFEFNVGATGVPTTAVWTGGLTTAVNSLKVFAYNWAGASWDQVGTFSGTTSLVVNEAQYDFTTAHVGTGGNIGLVRLRFQNTGLTSANFYTDQVLCGYTNVQTFPNNFSILGISAAGKINGVVLADTLTTYTGNTPQTGDSFARIGANGASLTALATQASVNTIDDFVDTEIADIQARLPAALVGGRMDSSTGAMAADVVTASAIATDAIGASEFAQGAADKVWSTAARILTAGTNIVLAKGLGVTGFTDLSAASVNAEVVDALATDTYAEPGQGTPAATTSLAAKINYLFKNWRNKKTQTATEFDLFADDAVTVDQKATVSDDGTTATRGELASGP